MLHHTYYGKTRYLAPHNASHVSKSHHGTAGGKTREVMRSMDRAVGCVCEDVT